MIMAMPTDGDEQFSEAYRIVSRFDERLKLARASELAGGGRLLEAEALLCPLGRHPNSAQELDLLARILVRQGRYDEARQCWREVADGDQRKKDAHDCIVALNGWLDHRRALFRWRVKLALWFVAANFIGTLLVWFGSH